MPSLQGPLLLGRRCVLGHAVRVFSGGLMGGRWSPCALGRPKFGLRTRGCSDALESSRNAIMHKSMSMPVFSWLEGEDTAYGGWSYGGTGLQNEKKKGVSFFLAIGGGTSVAICLAILVHLTFSNKGLRTCLYAPVAGIQQLFMPLTSTVTLLGSTQSSEDILSASEERTSELEDKYQKERDSETTETEVGRLPEKTPGKMLIPAVIDSAHREALSALQKLQIVESNIQPGELCTRREYARWLVSANSMFSRTPSYKVFPSVYIEGVTVLAFDDITPQDQDFPYIQGLAEAGVIPSKLSLNLLNSSINDRKQSHTWSMFYPENLLSRVDLVAWKMFAEHKNLREVDRRTLEKKSGFLDAKQICIDAWPAVFVDALTGDKSITARAFGYSRRFQPDKPVTKGQAAIALTSGRVAAVVSEELSRFEAENSVKQAVIQEILSELISRGEIRSLWEKDLDQAKQQRIEAERILGATVSELEKEKDEKERSLPSFIKEKTRLEFEHKFLSSLKHEVSELEKLIFDEKIEIQFEKEELEVLRTDSEVTMEALLKAKSSAEAEKKALVLSRTWAEEQARQTQAQMKIFAEAVKRWKFTKSSTCSCWCHQKDKTKDDVPQKEEKSAYAGEATKSF